MHSLLHTLLAVFAGNVRPQGIAVAAVERAAPFDGSRPGAGAPNGAEEGIADFHVEVLRHVLIGADRVDGLLGVGDGEAASVEDTVDGVLHIVGKQIGDEGCVVPGVIDAVRASVAKSEAGEMNVRDVRTENDPTTDGASSMPECSTREVAASCWARISEEKLARLRRVTRGVGATKVPFPRARTRCPEATRSPMARRTVIRLTP